MKTAQDFVQNARESIVEIDASSLAGLVATGDDLVLLDVRETEEFEQGHLPGAVNIPRGVLEFQVAAHPALACEPEAPELARPERPICVYCRSGARSALAAQRLGEMGFSHVKSLAGGFLDWQAHNLPVES